MATWKISGCTVKSGGRVEGDNAIAEGIRFELEAGAALYRVLPAPETVPVDVRSDWHLDRFVREVASSWDEAVETDYVQGPMPADVRTRLDAIRTAGNVPGRRIH